MSLTLTPRPHISASHDDCLVLRNVTVAYDRHVVLRRGDAHEGERPLLNHLAFLVDSAGQVEEEARSRGLDVENVVDAPNTLAVFLRGPDRIRIEYVEHKPGFSLV